MLRRHAHVPLGRKRTYSQREREDYERGFPLGVDWAETWASAVELQLLAERTVRPEWTSIPLNGLSLREFLEQVEGGRWGAELERDAFSEGFVDGAGTVYDKVALLLQTDTPGVRKRNDRAAASGRPHDSTR